MTPFLQSVAEAYLRRYSDLSNFSFVFPNKRSGTFFLNYLHGANNNNVRVAPEIVAVDDFIAMLGDSVADSRIDLLFTLYGCYLEVLAEERGTSKESERERVSFESFSGWADAIIKDFSEVDMYGVDARALFGNVSDFHEISTSFLTEEQQKVMEEYFGVVNCKENVDRFWNHFDYKSEANGEEKRATQIKSRFKSLWNRLGPLYTRFNETLEARGLCYTGGAYRKAVERVVTLGEKVAGGRKLVFVGFNVLSRMEWILFHELKKLQTATELGTEPLADFLWDMTGPFFADRDSSAAHFVSRNIRCFPHPEWIDLSGSEARSMPEVIEVTASPSGTYQAKIAGKKAGEIAARVPDEISAARAAVVLPDENLLLNLLYALPDSIKAANLTMGYPLRLTSTLSFIERIRHMRSHLTKVNGAPAYFHEDVTLLLAHPFVQMLLGEHDVNAIRKRISERRLFAITPEDLVKLAPGGELLFRLLPDGTPANTVIDHLDALLDRVLEAIRSAGAGLVKFELDSSHIEAYRNALLQLRYAIARHGISVNVTTIFSLADRLLAGETVRFQGKPLKGLQIMGLLETRALDFDYLIIPSMNDRIFPRRQRRRTFIPENIRRGYGLPSSGYEESIFAYYFYRLLSRAKEVYLIYDGRGGDGRGGDISRYVLQLKYLYAPELLKEVQRNFELHNAVSGDFSVDKTPEVINRLKRFTAEGKEGKKLSASAIMKYCRCPMQFFFQKVMDLPDDTEPEEFMDPLTIGSVVHSVLEDLYAGDSKGHILATPKTYTADDIRRMRMDKERIFSLLTYAVNVIHNHIDANDPKARTEPIKGEPAMHLDMLYKEIARTLEFDEKIAPITIHGVEVEGLVRVPVPGIDEPVNMVYKIDRVDEATVNGKRYFRIIDYKTGTAHTTAQSADEIFDGTKEAGNILQPLLYAHLFNFHRFGTMTGGNTVDIRPEIYEIEKLSLPDTNLLTIADEVEKEDTPALGEENKIAGGEAMAPSLRKIYSQKDVEHIFLPRLYDLIRRILTPSEPSFQPTADKSRCTYCAYKHFCRR